MIEIIVVVLLGGGGGRRWREISPNWLTVNFVVT